MSRRGNCWDNAVAKSFFASLKKERIKKRNYNNRDQAIAEVAISMASRRSILRIASSTSNGRISAIARLRRDGRS